LDSSDTNRLSVALVDVAEGKEAEFLALADQFGALLVRRKYGISEMIRDEAHPLRFYSVRRWHDAAAAAACHADLEAQSLTAGLYRLARITHIVNGARPADSRRLILDDQRARVEADRRTGFDRRVGDQPRAEGDRRGGQDRRLGPRRLLHRAGEIDLVAAARRAREHADVTFTHFKVGAALETADGLVVTGCNIETTRCSKRSRKAIACSRASPSSRTSTSRRLPAAPAARFSGSSAATSRSSSPISKNRPARTS
jgi:hypothetical protein